MSRARKVRARGRTAAPRSVKAIEARELRRVKAGLRRQARPPARWNADPDDVQRSLARLVLALVEFLRELMERQAIRRMEDGTLDMAQVESMGVALMRLEKTVKDMARRFGIDPAELNVDLGPLGRLR